MITHLDRLVHLLCEGIRRRPYFLPDLPTNLQLFKWYIDKHFDDEYQASIPANDLASKFDRLAERAIKPFVVGGRTLALHLTPELTEDFHGAKPPETMEYRDLLRQYEAIYINLPKRAYFIKEGLFLSGIFVMKFEHQVENPERRKALVSFSRSGSDESVMLVTFANGWWLAEQGSVN
ncbi:hypothetical protein D3C72_924730 [compost metagenome]